MRPLLTLILVVLLSVASHAQWSRIPIDRMYDYQPGKTILVDGTTIHVGSMGGIYRSNDGASTFVRCTTGIVDRASGCTGLVKIGQHLYASHGGNGGLGVYYSLDQGDTWVIDTLGWPNMNGIPTQMFAKKIRTWNDTYVFALLESNYTIYKKPSDAQWTVLPVPSDFRTPEDIFFHGDTIFLTRLGFGNPVTTWSTDLGVTWTTVTGTGATPAGTVWKNRSGPDIYSVMTNYVNGKPIHWLVRSTTNGAHWDTVRQCLNTQPACVYANGDVLIVSHVGSFTAADSVGRVILSTDRGATWTDISGNFQHLMGFSFHSLGALDIYNGNTLIAGVDLGTGILMRHLDIGTTSVNGALQASSAISGTALAVQDIIRLPVDISGRQYTLVDVRGRMHASGVINGDAVDISSLPSGAYVLTIGIDGADGRVPVLKH